MTQVDTPQKGLPFNAYTLTVASGTSIDVGNLVCADDNTVDGYAVPGKTKTNMRCVGVAQNDAAAGEKVSVFSGIFLLNNSTSSDQITSLDLFKVVYVAGPNTVAKTNGSSSRSIAGRAVALNSDGRVWVAIDPTANQS